MADATKIQWADHTWSPWIGCSPVHTGCDNCYARAEWGEKRRKRAEWVVNGTRSKTSEAYWRAPLRWKEGKVFPSLCDPFEDHNGSTPVVDHRGLTLWKDHVSGEVFTLGEATRVDMRNCTLRYLTLDDLRRDFFRLIDATPQLTWILATKRPENIRRMWPVWDEDAPDDLPGQKAMLENVWLVYSASDQETLEAGLPHLLACRDLAPVLGVSLEPLVGPVDLRKWLVQNGPAHWQCQECGGFQADYGRCLNCGEHGRYLSGSHAANHRSKDRVAGWVDRQPLDWIVVGGESGPNARLCNVEWIRDVVRQCQEADVSVFVKQLGTHAAPGWAMELAGVFGGNCRGGSTLRDKKGGDPSEWSEDLRVRQFPEA